MAAGADLAINLEAALQLRLVVFAERTGKRPFQPRRRHLFLARRRRGKAGSQAGEGKSGDDVSRFHDRPHALAPSTNSEIDFGNGLVFSKMPSSGRTMMKNAK